MSAGTIENILQEIVVLALGRGASHAEMTALKGMEGNGDWQPLLNLVTTYMAGVANSQGTAAALQMLAKNGLGMQLSDTDAAVFAPIIDLGQLSWVDLFALLINNTDSHGQTLTNRAEAAHGFLIDLVSVDKSGYYSGEAVNLAVKNLLQGIGATSASLDNGLSGLDALVANLTATGIKSFVVDGYVAGATVTIGSWTGTTDSQGGFVIPADVAGGTLTASGGTDLMTGKPFLGVLTAPAGSTVVNPITTLVEAMVSSGQSADIAAATSAVQQALGLPANINPLSYDPLAVLSSSTATAAEQAAALSVQATALQVANVITQAGAAIGAAGTGTQLAAGNAVIQALASAMSSGSAVDLGSATTLAGIMQSAATTSGAGTLTTAQVTQLSQITAASNTSAAAATTITALAQVAVVSQGNATTAITSAMTGSGDLGNALTAFSGSALTTAVNAAVPGEIAPGVVVPPVIPTPVLVPTPDSTPAPSFAVTGTGVGAYTVGIGHGNVVVSDSGTNYVFTPTTGSAVNVLKANVASLVVNTITLTGAAAVLNGETITGSGAVAVTALTSTAAADLSGISATTVTAASGGDVTFTGKFGTAAVAVTSGTLTIDGATTMGTATFAVSSGATLAGSATMLSGKTATGTGAVNVSALAADSNLSGLNSTLTVTAAVASSRDIQANTNLGTVDTYTVTTGQTLTMTAAQAVGKTISGAGGVTVTGTADAQTFSIATTGTNSITPGAGADQVTLGDGADTVVVAGAVAGAAEKDTLTFSTTNGDYYTDGKLYATIGGKEITADMVNNDAAGSLAALVTAINAANDDTSEAGLNGLLKTTDAAVSGVITLEATDTGATGFTVTDVKIDKAATTEKDTLTFSTTNGDYYTDGKLYATIGGKEITADMVNNDAAGSLAALVTAINAANDDTSEAGLNGLLKTTDAAVSGVITLEATDTGATGFTVTDVKIDKAATTEKDTLTFSTTNGDYYTGGKLYATIGGKAITADMVDNNAADSLAALVTAINAANDDTTEAGLNGLLKTTTVTGGVITLEAADTGATGFTVTDVKIDRAATTEKDTLTFSTTAGNYIDGGKLYATIGGKVIEADVVAGNAASSLAALVTAINAANDDTSEAGLNGLLKTTNAAAGGVITLEAATAGTAGFTVTDVKVGKPATAEKDTLTFSTTNGDYYTGGKLYATIGGKAIEAAMVNNSAADSVAALVTAINTSNADAAGLNGLLKTTTASSGVITLEAATAGAAGFTVADVKADAQEKGEIITLTIDPLDFYWDCQFSFSISDGIALKTFSTDIITNNAAGTITNLIADINAANLSAIKFNGRLKTTGPAVLVEGKYVITVEAVSSSTNLNVIDAGSGILYTGGGGTGASSIDTTSTPGHAAGTTNATVVETVGTEASIVNATVAETAGTDASTTNATVAETAGTNASTTNATVAETAGTNASMTNATVAETAGTDPSTTDAVVVETPGVTAGTASDSAATSSGSDVITGFSLDLDKIDLPSTAILTGLTDAVTGTDGLTVSVTDGLATFTGTGTVAQKIAGLLSAMNTDTKAAAFVDGQNTYLVYGDGVSGASDTDILVVLTGVDTTTSIATSAGSAALVIM